MPQVILVCGSRDWTGHQMIKRDLSALDPDTVIVHGDARGADRTAGRIACRLGLHVAAMPALWDVYGKAAGAMRNRAMLALHPDAVWAYSLGTSGTRDMINAARDAGILVIVRQPGDA